MNIPNPFSYFQGSRNTPDRAAAAQARSPSPGGAAESPQEHRSSQSGSQGQGASPGGSAAPTTRSGQGSDIPSPMGDAQAEREPVASIHAPRSGLHAHLHRAQSAGRMGLTGGSIATAASSGIQKVGVAVGHAVDSVAMGVGSVMGGIHLKSAYNAQSREMKLREVHGNVTRHECSEGGAEHRHLAETVMPYAINQMEKRYYRKLKASVPILGAGETAWRMGKNFKKWSDGTKGVKREEMADAWARHLAGHNCELAEAGLAALAGKSLMREVRAMPSDEGRKIIADKLKPN